MSRHNPFSRWSLSSPLRTGTESFGRGLVRGPHRSWPRLGAGVATNPRRAWHMVAILANVVASGWRKTDVRRMDSARDARHCRREPLRMNVAEVRRHRFTVDEYTRLAPVLAGQRTELVDGWVIDMAPIGTAHLTVVSRLQDMLVPQLQAGRVKVQQPLIVTGFDEPQPDVVILKEPLYLRKPAVADVELVIEVSDSTYAHDRDHKVPAYFRVGCRRVWLINISDHARPVLEIYAQPNQPMDRLSHGQVSVLSGLGVRDVGAVDLDELFAGVPELPADEYSEQP